jgi:hypothetical protein
MRAKRRSPHARPAVGMVDGIEDNKMLVVGNSR